MYSVIGHSSIQQQHINITSIINPLPLRLKGFCYCLGGQAEGGGAIGGQTGLSGNLCTQ